MLRPPRVELSGGLYHVTSRGDRREDIWCEMTNHYHVVVETAEGNLSQGMRQLNGVYSQHVNRRHRRVRHVFQGRYKAILVERN